MSLQEQEEIRQLRSQLDEMGQRQTATYVTELLSELTQMTKRRDELLLALEAVYKASISGEWAVPYHPCLAQAQAAIAKARGS